MTHPKLNRFRSYIGISILLIALIWVIGFAVSSNWRIAQSIVSPTPTAFAPTATSTSVPISINTPTPVTLEPDPRIAEFKNVYGIELEDQNCTAPCPNEILIPYGASPFTLQDFVEKVGPPEKVAAYLCCGERDDFVVHLFYISKGFDVYARRPAAGNYRDMTPDMVVYRLDLWRSRTKEAMITEMRSGFSIKTWLELSEDWPGFGPVKLIK
jgi:hypothetical protein